MRFTYKPLLSAVAAAVLSSHAASGWAADTVCSTVAAGAVTAVTSGSFSTPDTTIAVASNFYGPAQDLLKDYTAAGAPGNGKVIGLCHNATGHLMSEILRPLSSSHSINGTTYTAHPAVIVGEWLSAAIGYSYGLFLAANEKAPKDLIYSDTHTPPTNYTIGSERLYANGIPALLLNPNQYPSHDATDLVESEFSSPVEGLLYGNPSNPTGPVILDLNYLNSVAIGNPVPAPYGLAAEGIIAQMEQLPSSRSLYVDQGSNPNSSCGATSFGGIAGICEYDNIDVTLQAILSSTSGIPAGFVSWAQVLGLAGSPEYITFPAYPIPQWGVLLETDATDGTSNANETAALALWNFMNLGSPSTTNAYLGGGKSWNNWLVDHGYGAI